MPQTNAQALPPLLEREDMVPYKHMQNQVKLPIGSTHITVTAIGYSEHHCQEKLFVKLDDGVIYQAGDNLEKGTVDEWL